MGKKKKKSKNRATITVQKSEYLEWKNMKGKHTWTSLLRSVREKLTYLEKVIKNLTVNISQTRPIGSYIPPKSELTSNSLRTHPRSKSKGPPMRQEQSQIDRSFLIKEIKSLNIEDGNFRRVLKPMSEEELKEIQLDYGELTIRREKNEIEGKMLKEEAVAKNIKKEKKEKKIKLSDLRSPSPASTST